jgi:hypothetical protein
MNEAMGSTQWVAGAKRSGAPARQILAGLRRAGRMLLLCLGVAAALLTFPSAIP